MAANTRFAVAVHIAAVLARNGDEYTSSDRIAKSVCTNPVVIRRLLAALHQARIIESQLGKGGGARLAQSPSKLTLDKIFDAIEPEGLFAAPRKPANRACAVSCCMKEEMAKIFCATEKAVRGKLKSMTIADLVRSIG